MNCHHAIAGYGRDLLGERYNYFSLRIQNKLVASITANCFTPPFALHPLYGRLPKRLGNAKCQYLPSLKSSLRIQHSFSLQILVVLSLQLLSLGSTITIGLVAPLLTLCQ